MNDSIDVKMDNSIDMLVMLLSTDWFLNHWGKLGLQVEISVRKMMLSKCRALVVDMCEGESNYWFIPSGSKGLSFRKKQFFKVVEECKLASGSIAILHKILEGYPDESTNSNTVNLLVDLTYELVFYSRSEIKKDMPAELHKKISHFFKLSYEISSKIGYLYKNSSTDWDIFIQRLTPDLPEYVNDFASTICERMSYFDLFWIGLSDASSAEEKNILLEWYRNAALERANKTIDFPLWMRSL